MEKYFKTKILIFLITIGILTVLLSIGLLNMTLEKGMPFPEIDFEQGTFSITNNNNTTSIVSVSNLGIIILIIIISIGVIITLYKIIRKNNWKDLGMVFLYIFVIILVLAVIFSIILFFLQYSDVQQGELFIPPPDKNMTSPLGKIPVILIWIIGFIFIFLTSLIIIIILKSKKQKVQTPNKIKLEAILAKDEIQRGKDLKDVIIKYYHKMCIALQDEQEIKREESMTVEEFEKRIEATGAPQESIHQLTGLFEAVRYGNWEPGPIDEKEAIKCFDDIIRYFSETRKDDGKN